VRLLQRIGDLDDRWEFAGAGDDVGKGDLDGGLGEARGVRVELQTRQALAHLCKDVARRRPWSRWRRRRRPGRERPAAGGGIEDAGRRPVEAGFLGLVQQSGGQGGRRIKRPQGAAARIGQKGRIETRQDMKSLDLREIRRGATDPGGQVAGGGVKPGDRGAQGVGKVQVRRGFGGVGPKRGPRELGGVVDALSFRNGQRPASSELAGAGEIEPGQVVGRAVREVRSRTSRKAGISTTRLASRQVTVFLFCTQSRAVSSRNV